MFGVIEFPFVSFAMLQSKLVNHNAFTLGEMECLETEVPGFTLLQSTTQKLTDLQQKKNEASIKSLKLAVLDLIEIH